MLRFISIIVVFLISCAPVVRADETQSFPQRPDRTVSQLTLANIFSDHMILQQGQEVRIWGWAAARQAISVKFAGQEVKTTSNNNGAWQISLRPLKASFEGRSMTIASGGDKLTVRDILVGEVWVCGGQSNMERTLSSTRDADIELLSVDYPSIRFNRLPLVASEKEQADFPVDNNDAKSPGHWLSCDAENAGKCTAVGYYFARRLQRVLKCPIGIVDTSWGGTMAQHWVSLDTLKGIPEVRPAFEQQAAACKEWVDQGGEAGARKRYENDVEKWKQAIATLAKGKRAPGKPNIQSYRDPSLIERQPAGMMNAMITPLAGLSIKGVLFYQGENNCFGQWAPFPATFPAVISDWRKTFKDPELPFGIIQIAGWSTRRSMTYDMNHPTNIIREIQFNTWRRTPDSGLIVTFDCNVDGNIHPRHKQPVGQRSARWALATVYDVKDLHGRAIKWRGPIYESMDVKEGKCVIHFEKSSSEGLTLDKSVDVGFYIAGEDRVFHHAKAIADPRGSQLTVWSEEVEHPVAVRYASSNLPVGGLMNNQELPAYPFRTDNWPLKSHSDKEMYYVDKYK
ncbi:MAG: sialate O-acetylesterase [Phycisphaerae bacterium]|nr:sialate O-acetylesterase [Phycisphaerae bacterium]